MKTIRYNIKKKRGKEMKEVKRSSRKLRFRWDRLFLLVVGVVAAVFLVVKGIHLVLHDEYKQYTTYNEDNKADFQTERKEMESDTQYVSLFYPTKEDDSEFQSLIDEYLKQYESLEDQDEMKEVHYMDYEAVNLNQRYYSFTFHYQMFDESGTLLKEEYNTLNYDAGRKAKMNIDDVLRRDYETLLNDDFTSLDGLNFRLLESGFDVFEEGNFASKKTYPYKNNETYLRLNDPTINANAPKDVIYPAKKEHDTSKKRIAFTFDDGPHYEITSQIMDAFDEYGGSATFFMLGSNVERYPEIVKDMAKRGFEIGNHSYNHPDNLIGASQEDVFEQVYGTNDLLFQTCGYDAKLFRPPFGMYDAFMEEHLHTTIALWSIDTLDWKSRDAAAIKENVLANIHDGATILMHDLYPSTLEAVKELLPILHEQGYEFVSMSELV